MKIFYASQLGAHLDSDVFQGGGTDDTYILQQALDTAKNGETVHLIMDGAALISGLTVYSNTTIECPNPSCGFFLKADSNRAILWNAHWSMQSRADHHITLIGGTYNQNRQFQERRPTNISPDRQMIYNWNNPQGDRVYTTMGLQFIGVEHLSIRGLHVRDTQSFAVLIANWKWCDVSDIYISQPNLTHTENQDGFHFFGPGQFLRIRNVGGQASDDFIGIGADENEDNASITDVLIDGVFLENSDQGIRLLCAKNGCLDRVSIRNVTGTYRSFGFFFDPFFPESTGGHYGSILVEHVNICQTGIDYNYTSPFLFRIGGNWDCLTLRDIHVCHPSDGRSLFQLGSFPADPEDPRWPTHIHNLTIDNLTVIDGDPIDHIMELRRCTIDRLSLRNLYVSRQEPGGTLIQRQEDAFVKNVLVDGITAENINVI